MKGAPREIVRHILVPHPYERPSAVLRGRAKARPNLHYCHPVARPRDPVDDVGLLSLDTAVEPR